MFWSLARLLFKEIKREGHGSLRLLLHGSMSAARAIGLNRSAFTPNILLSSLPGTPLLERMRRSSAACVFLLHSGCVNKEIAYLCYCTLSVVLAVCWIFPLVTVMVSV